jgi:hypothetical protein
MQLKSEKDDIILQSVKEMEKQDKVAKLREKSQ